MNIAVYDTCPENAKMLAELISAHPDMKNTNIELYDSCSELLCQVNAGVFFDLAFIDILSPGCEGLKLGKQICKHSSETKIIFTSDKPDYSLQAFECFAFNYIVKPISKQKIKKILDIFFETMKSTDYPVKTRTGVVNLPIKNILYVESSYRHLIFHIADEVYETKGKISEIYDLFVSHRFCRVHQSLLVNMNKIERIEKLTITLYNGEKLPISQSKKSYVTKIYKEYLKNKNDGR